MLATILTAVTHLKNYSRSQSLYTMYTKQMSIHRKRRETVTWLLQIVNRSDMCLPNSAISPITNLLKSQSCATTDHHRCRLDDNFTDFLNNRPFSLNLIFSTDKQRRAVPLQQLNFL